MINHETLAFTDWMIVPKKLGMNNIPFEAVQKEDHTSTMAISENPIAYGANITDHSYREGATLNLEAIVHHNPSETYTDTTHGEKGTNRPAEFYYQIMQIQEQGLLVDVQSSLLLHKSMAITSCSAPRETTDQNAVIFTLQFKEIKIIDTQTVIYGKQKPAQPKYVKKASRINNKGAAQPTQQQPKDDYNFNNIYTKGQSYAKQFGL